MRKGQLALIAPLLVVVAGGFAHGQRRPNAIARVDGRKHLGTPGKKCNPERQPNPDDLLVLVNKDRSTRLARRYQPKDLRRIPHALMMPGRSGKLRKRPLRAIRDLVAAAKKDGLEIRIRSAFRSFHTQSRVFAAKSRQLGAFRAARVSAKPGHSQHQLGTTVDFVSESMNWELTPRFARKPEGRWLRDNAHKFGYVMSYPRGERGRTGYSYEPWHYRFVGVQAATEMREKEVLLEDYLSRCASCRNEYRCLRKAIK